MSLFKYWNLSPRSELVPLISEEGSNASALGGGRFEQGQRDIRKNDVRRLPARTALSGWLRGEFARNDDPVSLIFLVTSFAYNVAGFPIEPTPNPSLTGGEPFGNDRPQAPSKPYLITVFKERQSEINAIPFRNDVKH